MRGDRRLRRAVGRRADWADRRRGLRHPRDAAPARGQTASVGALASAAAPRCRIGRIGAMKGAGQAGSRCSARRRCWQPRRRPRLLHRALRPRWPPAMRRSCGWSARLPSAVPASRSCRPTCTSCSTTRRSPCAGPGAERSGQGRPQRRDLGHGLFRYHLDFPGDALDPGCDYEMWSRRVACASQSSPTPTWRPSRPIRASSRCSTGSSTPTTTGTTCTRATGR